MPTTKSRLADELLTKERAYLDAVQSKDGDAAAQLTAPESLVVSGRGAMRVDGAAIRKMVAEHDADREYQIDENSIETVEVTDDVAIISYKLRTTMPGGGTTSDAFDTDVWVRRNGDWACALHVETPAAAA
jgi:ketosteroid isomerase-like protein